MLKNGGRSGGPEEDRTPDLLIANETAASNINDLRRCNNGPNSPETGGECTNRAQWKIRAKLGRLIATFRTWWQTDDTEERHCWKCKKMTRWHPRRGCRECAWAERQW